MFDLRSIFSYISGNFSRKDFYLLIFIFSVFFFTRIIFITDFPIFSDEGIYIQWAKIAWKDANWRFISLTDGRQPLQTWGTIPFLKISGYEDALLGGRLFSVFSGFLALTGLISLLYYAFDKRTALIGSFLYIFVPYFLFYDRLALMDSGINAFFIWMLFFSILLVQTMRLDVALLFGFLAGFASLGKSTIRLFFITSFFAPILIYTKKLKFFYHGVANYIFLFVVSSAIAFLIYNVQRLSPFFHNVSSKNNTFVMSFHEFFASPFEYFFL